MFYSSPIKKTLLASAISCASLSMSAMADNASEIADLKARLAALEAKQESSGVSLSDRIKLSGTIEVEGSYTDSDGFSEDSHSDIVLATAELGLEASIAENITGTVVMLYEDDGDTELDVDVATITFADVAGMEILLGQEYVPFGSFETHLVNDTLVLEVAETRETVAMATYGQDNFSVSAYVFNGDADNGNQIENYGLSLNVGNEQFSAGLDYLSNVADTDGIFDLLTPAADISDTPEAWVLRTKLSLGAVTLLAEHFHADEFDLADWGVDFEPEAFHVEAGMAVGEWTLALAWQETEELAGVLPEERLSIGASRDITENVSLGIELWQDEDYSVADGGTGQDATSAVVQVAVSF